MDREEKREAVQKAGELFQHHFFIGLDDGEIENEKQSCVSTNISVGDLAGGLLSVMQKDPCVDAAVKMAALGRAMGMTTTSLPGSDELHKLFNPDCDK